MKAHLRCNGVTFEVEGASQKELFKNLAALQEVFAETTCGVCGSDEVRFAVRTVEENDYHEMVCCASGEQCGARLSFGQAKKGGTLFPIRKLDSKGKPDRVNGRYGPHRGWTKFRGNAVETDD